MKEIIIRSTSFFLVCLSLFSVLQYPVKARQEIYVALGDSISNGFGLENREQDCCVFLVGRHFGYETRNYGVDGLTSDGLLQKLENDTQMRESIKSASLITLEIGSNDLLGFFGELFGSGDNIVGAVLGVIADPQTKEKIRKVTEDVVDRLKTVIARVRELNPTAKLVVAEIYNPWYGMGIPTLPEYCDVHLGAINASIHAQAENYNYTVAEVHRPFKEQKLVCGDFSRLDFDPHPTVQGHEVYADMLIEAAEKELEGHFHIYGEWETADVDSHKKICACGNEITERHTWKSKGVVKKATHTETGERVLECEVCNAQKNEKIEKNNFHTYGNWETLGADEHKSVCACGDTKTEAHVWIEDTRLSTADEKAFVCSKCKAAKTQPAQNAEPKDEPKSFLLPAVILGAVLVFAGSVGVFFAIKNKKKKSEQ